MDFTYPTGATAILQLTSPNGFGFDSFSLSRTFPVPAGSSTYYLNGLMYSGGPGEQTFSCSSGVTVFFSESQLP
jgi:hypothetical protein